MSGRLDCQIETVWLADDGLVPNNLRHPLIVYRRAFDVTGADPERTIEHHFAGNDWSNAWVNGIYTFHHYHATAHEVLGLARGSATVQFGGPAGPKLTISAGDAVLVPAGVGHCRISSSANLSVVGAYPGGADWDLCRATSEARAAALIEIGRVPPMTSDPIQGSGGPATTVCRP